MSYIIQHSTLGFCWWDLPALIVLIAVIVYFVVRNSKMKKEKEDLKDQLADLYAADTDAATDEA